MFYVDVLGEHGLVAAMEDLPETYEWGCNQQVVNGADGLSIGTGYQNTMDIVNQECSTDIGGITAAQAALDAEINGYTDWYLPSRDELLEMYNTIGPGGQEGDIGGFYDDSIIDNYYWSSSEYYNSALNLNFAWFLDFNVNFDSQHYKNSPEKVRPIRSF